MTPYTSKSIQGFISYVGIKSEHEVCSLDLVVANVVTRVPKVKVY